MPAKRPEQKQKSEQIKKSEQAVVYENRMKKTVAVLEEEFATYRVGRADPHVLDRVTVNYYGADTPISQVGNITVPEARLLQIAPWESNMVKEIEKAIHAANLGFNPTSDGKVVRIVFPEPTEERRKEMSKRVKSEGEKSKVAIRNIRRDALEDFKKAEKKGEFTQDDVKDLELEIQDLTTRYINEVDKKVEAKSKDIMTV